MLEHIIEEWGGQAETAMDLYTDVFHLGEGCIQREGEPPGKFKANPIVIGHSGGEGGRMHRKIMFEDTFQETLGEACGWDWAFTSCCTYFGRANTSERQSKLYALAFDIDGVGDSNLKDLLFGIGNGVYPHPQHLVLSGGGVHLYYVFDEPISLFPNIKTQLKELKYALTRLLWNRHTSSAEKVQFQGINQAFRIPGSKTKEGSAVPVAKAYRIGRRLSSIEDLNRFVPEGSRVSLELRYRKAKVTIAEAKKLWPEWYARIISGGRRGQWVVKQDLYDWWLRKISTGDVAYGHRYFCIMALAIYAAKCGIYDVGRVRADAVSLIPRFNLISSDHPFTEADIDSALECLDGRFTTFPRHDIAKITGIEIPANKRNVRKQEQHLKIARFARDLNYDGDARWDDNNGRKPKRDLVRGYAFEHPEANHSEIARALGVSRSTVVKWLKPGWGDEFARGCDSHELFAEEVRRDLHSLGGDPRGRLQYCMIDFDSGEEVAEAGPFPHPGASQTTPPRPGRAQI